MKKRTLLILFLMIQSFGSNAQSSFLDEQKRYERVRNAVQEKEELISQTLTSNNLAIGSFELLMVAYKAEMKLDLYAKSPAEASYRKIAGYPLCAASGGLGPKRRQGDRQVPEGFYHIDRFNPASSYHLSLGINYPNASDRRKSAASNLGGDIFIHGSCVTIGCLPMTDDKIREIYLYAVHARNNGQQRIPVYIFPFEMTNAKWAQYNTRYRDQPEIIGFWSNLKSGYDGFHQERKGLKFSVDQKGEYIFAP